MERVCGDVKGLLWVFLTLLITIAVRVEAESSSLAHTSNLATQAGLGRQSSVKVFKYTNRQGVVSFSDRAPMHRQYKIIEVYRSCYACNLNSMVDWRSTPLHLNSLTVEIGMPAWINMCSAQKKVLSS